MDLKNLKEKFGKLKAAFKAAFAVECPLADGKVLTCDPECAEGAMAMLDGQAAPDGVYKCADGMVLTVAAGVITGIEPAPAGDPTEQAQSSDDFYKELLRELVSKFKTAKEFAEAFTAQQKELKANAEKIAKLESQLQAFGKSFTDVMAELEKIPAGDNPEKIKNTKEPVQGHGTMSRAASIFRKNLSEN